MVMEYKPERANVTVDAFNKKGGVSEYSAIGGRRSSEGEGHFLFRIRNGSPSNNPNAIDQRRSDITTLDRRRTHLYQKE